MFDVQGEIVIERPPGDVWRWAAADPAREQQWRNLDGRGVQELEQVDEGPVQVGTRFRGTVKVGPGKPQAYLNEVTAVDVPHLISWETIEADGPLGGRGSYRLDPLGDGDRTRFTIQLDYPPRTLVGRLVRPVVRLVGRRVIPRLLAKLKYLVESEPAAGGS